MVFSLNYLSIDVSGMLTSHTIVVLLSVSLFMFVSISFLCLGAPVLGMYTLTSVQFSSVQSLSHVRLFVTPWIAARQASLSITDLGVHSDLSSSSQWSHPAISSSVVRFSSCPRSLPASKSSPMSQLFAWGGQSIGVSALASVLPSVIPSYYIDPFIIIQSLPCLHYSFYFKGWYDCVSIATHTLSFLFS